MFWPQPTWKEKKRTCQTHENSSFHSKSFRYSYYESDFYPEVWGWPLVLWDDAERPRAETNVLAQNLNKFHSTNQTVATVQNSWYYMIIRGKYINKYGKRKYTDEQTYCNRLGWQIVMRPTGEYWRGSLGGDGHHQQGLRMALHQYEVLIVCQGVWSELHRVLTAHPGGNNTPLTRESPCQNIHENLSFLAMNQCNSTFTLQFIFLSSVFVTAGGASVYMYGITPATIMSKKFSCMSDSGIPFWYRHWFLTYLMTSSQRGGPQKAALSIQSNKEALTQANREVRSGRWVDSDMTAWGSQVFQLQCCLRQDRTESVTVHRVTVKDADQQSWDWTCVVYGHWDTPHKLVPHCTQQKAPPKDSPGRLLQGHQLSFKTGRAQPQQHMSIWAVSQEVVSTLKSCRHKTLQNRKATISTFSKFTFYWNECWNKRTETLSEPASACSQPS